MEEPDWSGQRQRPGKRLRMFDNMSDQALIDSFTPYLTTQKGKDGLFEILTRTDVETVYRMCRVSKALRDFCDTYQTRGIWWALFQRWATDEEVVRYTQYIQKVANYTRTRINWKWVVLTWEMMRVLNLPAKQPVHGEKSTYMTIPERFRISNVIDFVEFISNGSSENVEIRIVVGLRGLWMPPEISARISLIFNTWANLENVRAVDAGKLKEFEANKKRVFVIWKNKTRAAQDKLFIQSMYHMFVDGFGYGVLVDEQGTTIHNYKEPKGFYDRGTEWSRDKSYGIRDMIDNPTSDPEDWHEYQHPATKVGKDVSFDLVERRRRGGSGNKRKSGKRRRRRTQRRRGGSVSRSKARKILHHGKVHGKPLTDKQRRYFGWLASKSEIMGLASRLPIQGASMQDDTFRQQVIDLLNTKEKQETEQAIMMLRDRYARAVSDLYVTFDACNNKDPADNYMPYKTGSANSQHIRLCDDARTQQFAEDYPNSKTIAHDPNHVSHYAVIVLHEFGHVLDKNGVLEKVVPLLGSNTANGERYGDSTADMDKEERADLFAEWFLGGSRVVV